MVNLYDIQPGEDMLNKESVEYFLRNPKKLFRKVPQIHLTKIQGHIYKYHAFDGNNRLFVCYKLGIDEIPVKPKESIYDSLEFTSRLSREIYDEGIKGWGDFEYRVFPERLRDIISSAIIEEGRKNHKFQQGL